MHKAGWRMAGLCFLSCSQNPVAAWWPQHSLPVWQGPSGRDPTYSLYQCSWYWPFNFLDMGNEVISHVQKVLWKGGGKKRFIFNNFFFFQTLHLTSLPAGALYKTNSSHFIWENICSTIRKAAGEQQKLELYGWNVSPLLHSVLCIFKYQAKLRIGGNREIPNFNVCSAKSNKSVGLLGLCTFL